MGKHSWHPDRASKDRFPHPRPGRGAKGIGFAIMAAVFIGVLFVMGGSQLADPATCDNRPMYGRDRCIHHGRATETLLSNMPFRAGGPGHTLDEQIAHNRTTGWIAVGFGAFLLVTLTPMLWRDLRMRRHHTFEPDDAQPAHLFRFRSPSDDERERTS